MSRNGDGIVTTNFESYNDSMTIKFTGTLARREMVATASTNSDLLISSATSQS